MDIKTEIYENLEGKIITRHYLNLGDGHTHSLTTRQLYTLLTLCIVELGKRLRHDE